MGLAEGVKWLGASKIVIALWKVGAFLWDKRQSSGFIYAYLLPFNAFISSCLLIYILLKFLRSGLRQIRFKAESPLLLSLASPANLPLPCWKGQLFPSLEVPMRTSWGIFIEWRQQNDDSRWIPLCLPWLITPLLCGMRQVTEPLPASVSSSVKWGSNSNHRESLKDWISWYESNLSMLETLQQY